MKNLVTAAVALTLLATPVNCLCGAEVPSPHSLIGLASVLDAVDDPDQPSHHHGLSHHDHPHDASHHRVVPAHERSASAGPGMPTVQEVTPLGERAGAMAAVLTADLVLSTDRPRLVARKSVAWTGRVESPDIPPPRTAGALA
jgi:hypothetical protein